MTFLWPETLWLLALLPLLALGYVMVLRRKRGGAARLGSIAVVREAHARSRPVRQHIPPILVGLSLALLMISTARPTTEITLPSQRGTVILAMDISGSMLATDVAPSRLEAARNAARAFVEEQPPQVRLGLVVFAGTAAVAQAPTLNRSEVLAAIDRFNTQMGTAVGSAILTSLASIFEGDTSLDFDFIAPGGGRLFGDGAGRDVDIPRVHNPVPPGSYNNAVVVLLTDGQTTQGPDPVQAAQLAADLGVRVFTVGLGTREGAVLSFFGRSIRVQLDEDTLQTIADRTHGRYYHASSDTDLREVYRALSTELVLETEETEITFVFAAIAGLLLLAGTFLSMLWFNRLA